MPKNFFIVSRNEEYSFILDILKQLDCSVVLNSEHSDFTLVLGGDGTVLRAVREGCKSPFVIINTGHLGFLSSAPKEDALDFIKNVIEGTYTSVTRHLLHAQIKVGNPTNVRVNSPFYYAFNEVVIRPSAKDERNFSKLIEFSLWAKVEGAAPIFITDYRADGIIVSSPSGSTAYSLSAGGSIVHLSCNVLCITPICPQGLSQRPLIIPNDIQLIVEPHSEDTFLSIDGQTGERLESIHTVHISSNTKTIETINPTYSYFQVLRKKLGWGEHYLSKNT